jgi:hypothetical protein
MTNARSLRFLLTDKCNLKCVYCHNEFQGDVTVGHRPGWDLDRVLGLLGEARQGGLRRVKFSGGEPLLRWDSLLTLVDVCRSVDVDHFSVFSNLTHASEARLTTLRDRGFDKLHVNLPSFGEDFFAARTGQARWALPTVLQHARFARTLGIHVQFNMVVPEDLTEAGVGRFVAAELDAARGHSDAWDAVSLVVDDWGTGTRDRMLELVNGIARHTGAYGDHGGPSRAVTFDTAAGVVMAARCTSWGDPVEEADADVYVVPPGRALTEFVKGRAYRRERR